MQVTHTHTHTHTRTHARTHAHTHTQKKNIIPSQSSLRGHSKKLYKKKLKKDVKKYSFPDRAIDKWNALPEEEVYVKSIHDFKEKY